MSSSESGDFESADEQVSDIGEEELDQLLQESSQNDKVDSRTTVKSESTENKLPENIEESNSWDLEDDNIDIPLELSSLPQISPTSIISSVAIQATSTGKTDRVEPIDDVSKSSQKHKVESALKDVIAKQEFPDKAPALCTPVSGANVDTAVSSNECCNDKSGWEVDFEDDIDIMTMETEQTTSPTQDSAENNSSSKSGWSQWTSWGVNLLSTATEGVSSGFTSVLENTIGAPNPQILARQIKNENSEESSSHRDSVTGLVDNIIGGVSNLSTKVLTGGLDSLETIGKKTFEVLGKSDLALFHEEKTNLSQVLRDAKLKAEANSQEQNSEEPNSFRNTRYETRFDDFNGLFHLEALEMISKQCEVKFKDLLDSRTQCSVECNEALEKIKADCELDPFSSEPNSDLEGVLSVAKDLLSFDINVSNLLEVHSKILSQFSDSSSSLIEPDKIHYDAISDLAHFTACSIEIFHRIAEFLIIQEDYNVGHCFEAISRISNSAKCVVEKLCDYYITKLVGLNDKNCKPLITNIKLESINSSYYLNNTYDLFLPILLLLVLKKFMDHQD